MTKEMLTVIERRVKNNVKFFRRSEEMAWKAHFVEFQASFYCNRRGRRGKVQVMEDFVSGEENVKAFLSDSLYFHSEMRVKVFEELGGAEKRSSVLAVNVVNSS